MKQVDGGTNTKFYTAFRKRIFVPCSKLEHLVFEHHPFATGRTQNKEVGISAVRFEPGEVSAADDASGEINALVGADPSSCTHQKRSALDNFRELRGESYAKKIKPARTIESLSHHLLFYRHKWSTHVKTW